MSLTWRLPTGRGLWITRRFSPPTAKETATVLSQPPQVFFDASPVSGSTRKDGKGAVKKRSTSHAPTSSFVSGNGGGSSHHDAPAQQQQQHNQHHHQQQQHQHQHQHQRHQGDTQHHGRSHAPPPSGHHHHHHHQQAPQTQYAPQGQNQQQHQAPQQQQQQQQQQPPRRVVNGWEWFPGHGWYPASWADLQRQHPNQGFDMPNQQQQQQQHHQQQQQHQQQHQRAREAQFRRRVGWINSVEDFAFLGCTVAFVWFVIPDLADQIYLGRGADALANRIVFERAVRKKNKKDNERAVSAGGVPGEGDDTELSGSASSAAASSSDSASTPTSGFSPYSPKPGFSLGSPKKTVAIKGDASSSSKEGESAAPITVTKGESGPPPKTVEIKGDDEGDAGCITPKKK